jgi:DNA processing protein
MRYASPADLLAQSAAQIDKDPFLNDKEREAIKNPDIDLANEMLRRAWDMGASVLTPQERQYPELLRNIPAMPLVLYVLGDAGLLNNRYVIAMVGTRRPDEYGLSAAHKLSHSFASLGAVIVSGLAMGIDAACHSAALEAGGETVAFLAGGLDCSCPASNRALARKIIDNGALVSEYAPGTAALPSHFPIRNRLVSGVSMATVIVQGAQKSGSMLTVGHAAEQGRDVFAVPGSILAPSCEGCNMLLARGVRPALKAEEILSPYIDAYGYPVKNAQEGKNLLLAPPGPGAPPDASAFSHLPADQARLMALLANAPMTADDLAQRLALPAQEILSLLTQMEIFGLVQALPGRIYRALK